MQGVIEPSRRRRNNWTQQAVENGFLSIMAKP